ncbi:uncharacterized protein LOC120339261 [Styela clava]
MHTLYVLFSTVIIGCVFSEQHGINYFQNRLKRSIHKNVATRSCFDEFEVCRKNTKCRIALMGLDDKCKVVSERCSAEMVDLPRCGQIMDHLFQYGFPQTKCNCDQNSEECNKLHEKIYNNPCFGSIRHLRKLNIFPKEVNAYDAAKGFETTTTSPVRVTSQSNVNMKSGIAGTTQKETTMSFFDEVFGGRKSTHSEYQTQSNISGEMITSSPFAKNKSRRKDNVKRHQRIANSRIKVGVMSFEKPKLGQNVAAHQPTMTTTALLKSTIVPKRHVKTSEGRNVELMRENKVFATFEMKDNKGRVEVKIPTEYEWKEENTDFKAIAIIFGILLGMFMIAAIVLFIWTRTKKSIFHKRGKLVQENSRDEVTDHNFSTNRLYNNNHRLNV